VLAEHFVRKHAHRSGRPAQRLHESALAVLQRTTGPATHASSRTRSSARSSSRASRSSAPTDFGLRVAAPRLPGLPSMRLHQNIRVMERERSGRALDSSGGIKKDAAELMGISQRAAEPLPRQAPPVGPTALIVYESRNRLRPP